MKKNPLCELLGIRHPIIQAPMNWISGAKLVAAVSNAGCLGTLGPNAGAKTITRDVALTGENLRTQIKAVRSLTKNPFAVNIPIGTSDQHPYADRFVQVALEEGITVAIVSAGSPARYTSRLKEAGVKVLHTISTAAHAKKANAAGVDAVICIGFEAGGHNGFSQLTTLALIPMVADAVRIPIVAGGGICDGRGLLAALALGADGVYMGTRFMVTQESDSHPRVKETVLKAEDVCTVDLHKDKTLTRVLRNSFSEEYLQMLGKAGSKESDDFSREHSPYHSLVLGDCENAEIPCGQGAGLIGSLVSTAELIQGIVNEIPHTLKRVQDRLISFS
ncbi:MAG: nitronate monooxygenase [Deltaproteobacteria bacterium]|nr:MAG: nitronate monooxygenase [Deltaproteobacteria bacterium]